MSDDLVSLSDRLAQITEQTAASVVSVQARPRIGTSGLIWRENLVITTNEGIRLEDNIHVLRPDGRIVEGRLQGRDQQTDLALIEADLAGCESVSFSDDKTIRTGELVVGVGRTSNTGPIASLGLVSGVSGSWKTWRGGKLDRFVRLDLPVFATSSGAAIVNASGHVIGLVSTALSRSSVLALTSSTIERITQQLLEKGYVPRPFLGVTVQPVRIQGETKRRLDLQQDSGIMLIGVEPDSPAEKAELTIGDVLLEMDGRQISDPEQFAKALNSAKVGDSLNLKLLRGGELRGLQVVLGERVRRER